MQLLLLVKDHQNSQWPGEVKSVGRTCSRSPATRLRSWGEAWRCTSGASSSCTSSVGLVPLALDTFPSVRRWLRAAITRDADVAGFNFAELCHSPKLLF